MSELLTETDAEGNHLGYLNRLPLSAPRLRLKVVNQSPEWYNRQMLGESWALKLIWDFFSVSVTMQHLQEGYGVTPFDLTSRRSSGYLMELYQVQKEAFLSALTEVCAKTGESKMTIALRLRACPYDWYYNFGPGAEHYTTEDLEDIGLMVKLSKGPQRSHWSANNLSGTTELQATIHYHRPDCISMEGDCKRHRSLGLWVRASSCLPRGGKYHLRRVGSPSHSSFTDVQRAEAPHKDSSA